MNTPQPASSLYPDPVPRPSAFPTALEVACYAVSLLELCALFNSSHGAVFTRDGIQELEASVMVAGPPHIAKRYPKRAVGVMGVRRVKHPVLLAGEMLKRGEADLWGRQKKPAWKSSNEGEPPGEPRDVALEPDVPSAQGHTLVFGETAESLARQYGLELVDPGWFFTQKRWDEHVRALEREREELLVERQFGGENSGGPARSGITGGRERGEAQSVAATWDPESYLPQGTCGAVALDACGLICCATSTGGLTNKLTGRIGDTPTPGAGFWAEDWEEDEEWGAAGVVTGSSWECRMGAQLSNLAAGVVELSNHLRGLLADCFPMPLLYAPVPYRHSLPASSPRTRSHRRVMALSGTGNGDSFLRTSAARSVGSIARYAGVPTAEAVRRFTGPGGELQRSAGDRWGATGEGEGGMIAIECEYALLREGENEATSAKSVVIHDLNCAGMFRAWIDGEGKAVMRVWKGEDDDDLRRLGYKGEGVAEHVPSWLDEKRCIVGPS